jgi:uncharacterized protein involved in exopolysaccharide biosynthesis
MQEEEIGLREYINVLIKRKTLIILFFLIAVIASAIVSYFIMEPVYQANTVITVLQPKMENSFISELSLEDYRNLIKDTEIEEEIIQKLNLTKPPFEMTPYDLEKMLTIELYKSNNIIKMSLQTSEPKLSKDIVDAWAALFVEKNKALYFDEVKNVNIDIEEKLKLAEEEYFEIDENIKKFTNTSNIEMIESEIRSKMAKVIESKLRLFDIDTSFEIEKSKRGQIAIELSRQEKLISLNKSIIDDQFFRRLIPKITDDNFDITNFAYISEERNPIYYNLTEQLISSNIAMTTLQTEKNQLEKNINFLNSDLIKLKEELAEKEITLARLYREYFAKDKLYNYFYKQSEEIRLSLEAEMDLLKITNLASEPKSPIKPNKKINILVAGFLGLFIGVIVAFFAESWQKG